MPSRRVPGTARRSVVRAAYTRRRPQRRRPTREPSPAQAEPVATYARRDVGLQLAVVPAQRLRRRHRRAARLVLIPIRPAPPTEAAVRLEGSLDAFSLPDIFALLSMTKKTGGLHLRRSHAHGVVWFTTGSLTGGASDVSRQSLARRVVGSVNVERRRARARGQRRLPTRASAWSARCSRPASSTRACCRPRRRAHRRHRVRPAALARRRLRLRRRRGQPGRRRRDPPGRRRRRRGPSSARGVEDRRRSDPVAGRGTDRARRADRATRSSPATSGRCWRWSTAAAASLRSSAWPAAVSSPSCPPSPTWSAVACCASTTATTCRRCCARHDLLADRSRPAVPSSAPQRARAGRAPRPPPLRAAPSTSRKRTTTRPTRKTAEPPARADPHCCAVPTAGRDHAQAA